jgi:hypothetical protein
MKRNQHVNWHDGHERKSGRITDVVTDDRGKVTGVKIAVGSAIVYRDVKRGKIVGEG